MCKDTGLPDYEYMKNTEGYDFYFGKRIIATTPDNDLSGEGPEIVYDENSGYYYLFVSYGGLDSLGGYNIRQYRSKSPDGPYLDAKGNSATDITNTGVKILGNYTLGCLDTAYLSGGHSSCFRTDDGKLLKVPQSKLENADCENSQAPGTVLSLDGTITVACGRGKISFLIVLPEGKGKMAAADYIRGRKISVGDRLGK
jgi:arabinan endo-1,5-alpha-L-arabinosidase